MRGLLFAILCCTCLPGWSQVVLTRSVICPVAVSGEGSYLIQGTAGQPADKTIESESITLTQGFQQPDFVRLFATTQITWPECDNGNGATVTFSNFGGCAGEEVEILFNGAPADTVVFNVPTGTYDVLISSGAGCSRMVQVEVPVPPIPPCNLQFFNAFTPNNDGENDQWVIGNIQFGNFAENQVSIFNRWGAVVWESNGYDNQSVVWDGTTSDGERLPDGTYYYLVEVAGETFQGFVEIMR